METTYCHIHEQTEEIPEGDDSRLCMECGHVYKDNVELHEAMNATRPSGMPEISLEEAEKMGFCPLCLHDFWPGM